MRIAEYKQIDSEVIESTMPVIDEDGNETGETEVIRKEVPIMGMVYRDATPEEEAEQARLAEEMPEPQPTIEDRIASLEAEVNALKSYINSIGKTELQGEGTAENPFKLTEGIELIPNAYYTYNGVRYVYMGAKMNWDGSEISFENGWTEF